MDAHEWNQRYAAADLVWGAEPNRFVAAELAGVVPGRALDLAAGEGRNALWLARRGWRVTAVDFSSVAIERGRAMAQARGVDVDWVVADARYYQPSVAGYDAVVVAYVHLTPADLRQVLKHAIEALAPGGTLLVVGHDVTNLTDGVGGPPDAAILYTPEGILADLSALNDGIGLAVRRAERVRRPVPTDDGIVNAIDTLVCAVRTR